MPEPGNPQALNRYSYVYNNPLKHVDVSGHFPWIIVGGLVGMGIAYGGQVVGNMNSGMELGEALTTNIDLGTVATGGLIGMAVGTGVGLVAPVVVGAVGGGTAATTASGAAAAAGTLVLAEATDGEYEDEKRILEAGSRIVGNSTSPSTSAGTPFGEQLYQFSGRRGGFKTNLNSGELEMSLSRVSDFNSPAEAFEATFGRAPSSSEMYRVTTVGTAWYHHFYPVYNSLEDGNPFGHVSLYPAGAWDQEAFNRLFDPRLFGSPRPVIPQ